MFILFEGRNPLVYLSLAFFERFHSSFHFFSAISSWTFSQGTSPYAQNTQFQP